MSKVSFTVRQPTPDSRGTSSGPDSDSGSFKKPALPKHLSTHSPLRHSTTKPKGKPISYYDGQPDSSDEEDEEQDELVTGFDRFGVERCVDFLLLPSQRSEIQLTQVLFHDRKHKKPRAPKGPLVIAPLQNRDWRELARKRRTAGSFVPDAGKAKTGEDGSVGGLGTREIINSGPQEAGLQLQGKRAPESDDEEPADVTMAAPEPEPESEDAIALRAILAETAGQPSSVMTISAPLSEKDALAEDVIALPESATLDDYARVPIEQFGAALLRGMGWTEGTAATRKKGKGMVNPYIPEARPALLGIGAKEREPLDDGSTKKKGRPDKKYVPLIKQDREPGRDKGREEDSQRRRDRSGSPRRERDRESRSRRESRSPPPRRREYDDERRGSHRKDDDRDRDRNDYSHRDRRRDSERGSRRY